MESSLRIKVVGNYKIPQQNSNAMNLPTNDTFDDCKICHNPDYGDVLINGICGKCLLHHYDSTIGLHVTDKPEVINPDQKKYFWELT